MRIRRNASRLLGSAVCAPPRFELPAPSGFELPPAPSGFELPPPAEESHLAGFVSKISSSLSEPCVESLSPWDLMGQLDLSDPQAEECFLEDYSVPVVRRASSLFSPTMPAAAGSLEKEELDMVLELNLAEKKKAARKKNQSKPETEKREGKGERYRWRVTPELEESGNGKAVVEESDPRPARGRGAQSWTCNKKNSKGLSCRRPVSRPDSLCRYHCDPKLPARRKRTTALGAGEEGFYYYTGFGPSRSTKRQRSVLLLPARDKEEAQLPEEHTDATPSNPAKADQHQVAAPTRVRVTDDKSMAAIAGCDEDISSSDDDSALRGCNGEPAPGAMIKKKRKPLKVRSINFLM